ncbi:MAG: TonB family protein [Bacteroides sp.]|nr:TonB family protein [Bacteroides sp.]
MGAFFVYILKSAVCLAVFYLFYRLLLSKETFHRFNRIALLGILILSCVIPFAEVTVKEPMEVSQQFLTLEELLLMADLNRAATVEAAPVSMITWRETLLIVYILGIIFFFLRNLWSLGRMLRLIKGSNIARQENSITLITHQKDIAPFSWMKFVVISEKDLMENGEEILTHEYAHIHKRHSIDLLIADICIFFQWFNPASWLLKQELQNIHEFEADESVIAQGIDAKKYQLLLIKKAVGTRLYSMGNSFNHSSLKKRITMMLKKKSNPWARFKYLYVLPLAAIAVAAFARPEISNELGEISAVKVNDLTAIMKTEEVKSVETVSVQSEKKIRVVGKVYDKEDNTPIVGASIIIEGTTSGTISDLDGNFVIEMKEGEKLRFSYINYATKIVPVPAGTEGLKVLLEKDGSAGKTDLIGEIVAVGYTPVAVDDDPSYQIFQVVEEMPEFPGGIGECLKFLGKNIKYPVEAQQAGAQGKVIVQFVVEKDGSIANPKVVRSIDPNLDGEAIRVISIMPKWKPGMQKGQPVRVKYTVPVTFRLDGKNNKTTTVNLDGIPAERLPLIVVDGQKVPYEIMKLIDANKIDSIQILKGEQALQYGEEGKNGVILITTKK